MSHGFDVGDAGSTQGVYVENMADFVEALGLSDFYLKAVGI